MAVNRPLNAAVCSHAPVSGNYTKPTSQTKKT